MKTFHRKYTLLVWVSGGLMCDVDIGVDRGVHVRGAYRNILIGYELSIGGVEKNGS